jgi:hypothetical protein
MVPSYSRIYGMTTHSEFIFIQRWQEKSVCRISVTAWAMEMLEAVTSFRRKCLLKLMRSRFVVDPSSQDNAFSLLHIERLCKQQ